MMGGGLTNQESLFNSALSKAKQHLMSSASAMGADAVIGIHQSFTSPGGVNYMILALIGTAVTLKQSIEEDEEDEDELPPL